MENANAPIMNREQFDKFIEGDVVNFMVAHNLSKIVVEDGTGRKGNVKVNKNGEYIVLTTHKNVM